jgi:hypothetical protein
VVLVRMMMMVMMMMCLPMCGHKNLLKDRHLIVQSFGLTGKASDGPSVNDLEKHAV